MALQTQYEYQQEGILRTVKRYGRIPDGGAPWPDPVVSESSLPWEEIRCQADWACLPLGFKVEEEVGAVTTVLREGTLFRASSFKDITQIDAWLGYPNEAPPALHRNATFGTGAHPDAVIGSPSEWHTLVNFVVDEFGNTTRRLGASTAERPCTDIEFDDVYRQFPRTIRAWTGSSCTGTALRTELTFDRGLQQLTSQVAPDERSRTTLDYDGFGHLKSAATPVPDGDPFATEIALDAETVMAGPTPYVRVSRRADADEYIHSVEVFNGLGEHVLGFDEADVTVDGAPWVARDWTERDASGRVTSRRRPWFFSGDAAVVAATAAPVTPAGRVSSRSMIRSAVSSRRSIPASAGS